jgi:hypothetical protein
MFDLLCLRHDGYSALFRSVGGVTDGDGVDVGWMMFAERRPALRLCLN